MDGCELSHHENRESCRVRHRTNSCAPAKSKPSSRNAVQSGSAGQTKWRDPLTVCNWFNQGDYSSMKLSA